MLKPIFSSYSNQQFFTRLKKKVNHRFKYSSTRNISPRGYIGRQRFFLKSAKKSDKKCARYKKKKTKNKQTNKQREREREGEINGTYSIFSDKS